MEEEELKRKITNGIPSGSESNSKKSSAVSSAISGKHSLQKNVNNHGNIEVKEKNKTSSISDNSTSIDEELSCEIAIEPSSSEEEEVDPVQRIIKEYLGGDASSLNRKEPSKNNNNNNSRKAIVDSRGAPRESSECENKGKTIDNLNRKVSSTNKKYEKLYKTLSPPITAPNNHNANVIGKYSKNKKNLCKSNYLDLKLTLTKKESLSGVPSVQSSTFTRPRTAASLPRRPFYKKPQEKEVGRYPHSLKLLGVQIPDEVSTSARQSRAFRSTSSQSWIDTPAKIQTRVQRRSVSLDDVKRVIPFLKDPAHLKSTFLNEHQRAVLNQAIYEEWYDVRGKEIKRKKLKEREEKEREEERKKSTEEERKRRNEGVYNNWIKEKAKTKKDTKPSENKTVPGKGESEIKYSDSFAFQSWKESKHTKAAERLKEKLDKERERKLKEIRDKAEQRKKREDADKAFEAWLRMKKEKLKKQWNELQEYKIKLQEEELTRRHDAEIAFNFWKKKKEEEKSAKLDCGLTDSIKDRVVTPSKVQEKNKLETVLSSGHPPSYEEWLDYVEDREDSYMMQMGKIALECSMKPPWNPGGGMAAE